MKRKSIFIILVILITTSMIVFVNLELLASPTTVLTSELISNRQETNRGNSIFYLDAKTSQSAAHIAWGESTTTTYPYDDDIFYRQLPYSETINLSDNVPTVGPAGTVMVQPSTGTNACVLWSEQTGVEEASLFIWRSASNSTNISPSPVGKSPNVTFAPFNCNDAEDARIVFVTSENELYLWDEETDMLTKLSNNGDGGIGNLQRIDINNDFYIAWTEPPEGINSSGVYLWDSISETTQQLAQNGFDLQLLKDKNDIVYLFWEQPGLVLLCYYYWTTQTQSSELLVPCDDLELEIAQDGVGDIHIAWHEKVGITSINYWNITQNITDTIDTSNQAVGKMNLIGGSDNKAHLFWQSNGLYYWNSDALSEMRITSASSSIQERFTWDFDSNGQIHTVWADSVSTNYKNVAYWTPSLTSPLILTDNVYVNNSNIGLLIDGQDVAHSVFSGSDGKLYYWDNQTNQIEIIANPNQNISSRIIDLVLDKNDEIFAFYKTSSSSNYYWNSESGESYLGRGEIDKHSVPMLDGMNNLYVYWIAGNDINLEGQDIYAAWQPDFNYFVYLPIALK